MVLKADEEDDDLVAKLKEKQTFHTRLGELFRKNNVSAVLRGWDTNGDGTVDLAEMTQGLALIGHVEQIEEFFRSIDVDKSGTIERAELVAVVEVRRGHRSAHAPRRACRGFAQEPRSVRRASGSLWLRPQAMSRVPPATSPSVMHRRTTPVAPLAAPIVASVPA